MRSSTFLTCLGALTSTALAANVQKACTVSLKSTPPAPAYCDDQGTIAHPKPGKLSNQGSTDDCAAACFQLKPVQCSSFSYDPDTGNCQFYKQSLRTMGFKQKSTGNDIVDYDRACYSGVCTQYCSYDEQDIPQNPDGNLISNPSFEQGATGWNAAPQLFVRSCTNFAHPYDGIRFARLAQGAIITPDITTAGTNISVQLYYRIENNPSGGNLSLIITNNESNYYSINIGTTSNAVYQVLQQSVTFNAPGSNSLQFASGGDGAYAIEVDYVTAYDS